MTAYLAHPPAQTTQTAPPTPSTTSALLTWRRSSYSVGMNNCVETARTGADVLAVRDSKNVALPQLRFTPTAWTSFVSGVVPGLISGPAEEDITA
ncbi:DUF397 domain-containing protein [Streptomyces sp. NPDC088725]|uniref:DUF397 domain-containing protein n=1 Tax=Streptomyces sp. NPDC088725 TaxID=3365873 RepID=UPI00382E1F48